MLIGLIDGMMIQVEMIGRVVTALLVHLLSNE
jgi:hypothetical protein